jgi:replicative superfamily II helicase
VGCFCAQVLDCAGKHQVLIFVHSRKETAKTAQYLKQTALDNDHLAKFMRDDSASREILQVRFLVQGCCCKETSDMVLHAPDQL